MRKQASSSSIKYSASFKQQTERALKTINEHEKLKQMWSMSVYIRAQTQANHQVDHHPIKIFNPNQQVKLQLLPNSTAYYKLPFSASIDPRIVIRQFRGGPVNIYVFFNKISKDFDGAAYHFVVRDQIILKFGRKIQPDQVSHIIFVFRNDSNLSMLLFRVDNVRDKKKKKGIRHQHSTEKLDNQKSIQSIDLDAQSQNKINIPTIAHRRNKSIKDKLRSVSLSAQLLSQRPQHKLKKIQQLKSIQIQKQQAAKKRVGNLEIFKQKSAQLERVAAKCKKMFSTYEDLVVQQEQMRSNIVRTCTPILYLMKYCLISSFFHNEKDRSMKRAMTVKSYYKKFNRKIRKAYFETLKSEPSKSLRQQQAVEHIASLTGHILFKINIKSAGVVALQAFQLCRPGMLINMAMNKSSDYRRVVRGIQRRWKSRFQARTSMLLGYAEQQLQVIIKSYPQLSYVEQDYRKANRAYYTVIQYQKDTASKLMDFIGAYYHKLEQIEQYKKLNKQIIQFNATALKKHIKQLLDVPKKPAFPQFRFFRDVLFLKAMIRGELEVLLRKLKKTNPDLFKDKEISPVKIQKKLKKSK